MQVSHLEYHRGAERDHWWFAARREIVLAQVGRFLGRPAPGRERRVLDIGCGAGGMLAFLEAYGRASGVDASAEAVDMARAQGGDVRRGALPDDIPFADGTFDLITLLDVLEHVEEDARALDRIRRLLRPDGLLIVTVPAFRFLWSGHDVVNEHRRRYVRAGLALRLREAGFRIERITYFNTLLFPPIAAVRVLGRLRGGAARADQGTVPGPVNGLLRRIFSMEKRLLTAGNLPFGVSLLAVARAGGPRKDEP